MTWHALMRGFLAPMNEDRWIEGGLTVEMVGTLRLPRLPRAINSGPNSAETLHYYSNFRSDTRTLFVFLSCFLRPSKRLVMSFLSCPTSSSSAPPSLCPLHPSSSSLSSSSSNSSTTEPLPVGAIQVLHPVESVARGTTREVLPTGRVLLSSHLCF